MTWPQILRAIDRLDELLRDMYQHRELLYPQIERGEPGARAALVKSLRDEARLRAAALRLRNRVERMAEELAS